MRLKAWRARAPVQETVAAKVMRIVESALVTIGSDADPECWVVWGDDPAIRYLIFVPMPAGLAQVNVRVNVPGEGPRAAAKLVRWARVQTGELSVEIHGGHRLVTFQVEGNVLTGVDTQGDAIADFAQALFAAMDGRAAPTVPRRRVAAPRKTPVKPPRPTRLPAVRGS